jgi:hypothetical protein
VLMAGVKPVRLSALSGMLLSAPPGAFDLAA